VSFVLSFAALRDIDDVGMREGLQSEDLDVVLM